MTIKDFFKGPDLDKINGLWAGDFFTTIYMASSKYYRKSESMQDDYSTDQLIDSLNTDNATIIYQLINNKLKRIDVSAQSAGIDL